MTDTTQPAPISFAADCDRPLYKVYGLTLASDFKFANRLTPGHGQPDLTFTLSDSSPIGDRLENADPVYSAPGVDDFATANYLYRICECDVMRYEGIADFYLWPDQIVCHLRHPRYYYTVEIYLLGAVLSFWLGSRGMPALHASSVVIGDRAVAFLSTGGGGKTSIAAQMAILGCSLLTDDILPIEPRVDSVWARPGYPQMRMWPEEASYFLGNYESLELVNPHYSKRRVAVGPKGIGAFCEESKSLGCVYLPERQDPVLFGTGIDIKPVSPRDAVVELVRGSFAARNSEAAGLQRQRLGIFSEIARRVPMRRLLYPSGLHHLPDVAKSILADFMTNPAPPNEEEYDG